MTEKQSSALARRTPATAIATTDPTRLGDIGDVMNVGKMLAASGFFQDARQEAQAVAKVLAGRELGFGPVTAMTDIYIVKGRVTLSAHLMAALVKRHPRYDYRVVRLDNEACELRFFEDGEPLEPTSEFTIKDAQLAGIAGGDSWKRYPRNMLFARAMTNGIAVHCPDVSTSRLYLPEELGAEVDGQTGSTVDAEPVELPPHDESSDAVDLDAENERLMRDELGFLDRKIEVTLDNARTVEEKRALNERLEAAVAEKAKP